MADLSDADLERAERAGQAMLAAEPRAAAARFDQATGRIIVELTNGCLYAFPPGLVQDLRQASAAQLAGVQVDGQGFNLHFPALVAGVFGTREWMTRGLARIAGSATSPAKASAARANGAKGGRPRKAAVG